MLLRDAWSAAIVYDAMRGIADVDRRELARLRRWYAERMAGVASMLDDLERVS